MVRQTRPQFNFKANLETGTRMVSPPFSESMKISGRKPAQSRAAARPWAGWSNPVGILFFGQHGELIAPGCGPHALGKIDISSANSIRCLERLDMPVVEEVIKALAMQTIG